MNAIDVVVVGAGPAGSATAASLSSSGARVVLVEAAHHPRPKTCAEYASPRIVEELARIGIPPAAWAEDAVPLEGMHLVAGDRTVPMCYADRGGPRTAWGLDRPRFDARLAAHAAESGADLREGRRVTATLGDAGVRGVRTVDRSGREERIEADWVIGADGARSTVARLLGVERPVRFPRRLGLVAHYAGVAEPRTHGEMHVGRDWYVGLAPTPDGEMNVGMALPMEGRGGSATDRYESAIRALPAMSARLAEGRRITPIRGAAPIGHRVSDVAGDGWLLVGDAAGFVDPFTGEGIHRALRSARAAATAIGAGGDVAAAYRRERRRAFAAKTALSWLVQGFLAFPPLLGHAVERLADRPATALRLGSALGDCAPATSALSPRALLEVVGP